MDIEEYLSQIEDMKKPYKKNKTVEDRIKELEEEIKENKQKIKDRIKEIEIYNNKKATIVNKSKPKKEQEKKIKGKYFDRLAYDLNQVGGIQKTKTSIIIKSGTPYDLNRIKRVKKYN